MNHVGGTILVVDDDASVSALLEIVLEDEGFHPVSANGGQEAIDLLFEDGLRPDAVVLDWMMPDVDGLTVLTAVRAHDAIADIPVVMLTAKQGRDDEALALDLGADTYVRKPFDPSMLASLLSMTISIGARDRYIARLERLAELGHDGNAVPHRT